MNRFVVLFCFCVLSVVIGTTQHVRAQGARGAASPEAAAARQKQLALEAATPKLQITEEHLTLSVPGHTIGETVGVSKKSKGHLFVYSGTDTGGSARAAQPHSCSSSTKISSS